MINISRLPFNQIIAMYFLPFLVLSLPGCQITAPATEGPARVESIQSPPPTIPVKNSVHYLINPDQSEIRILVFRGGPLAKFGHNHVMLAKEITGDVYLAQDINDSVFRLVFPVTQIEIDPPKARSEEGKDFDTQLSPEAIDATRKNMLGREVLDADNYPDITIQSVEFKGSGKIYQATIQITLRGITKELSTPVFVKHAGDDLTTNGTLILRTSDFDIKPFSVLGGGLQVLDEIKIRFHIHAEKA